MAEDRTAEPVVPVDGDTFEYLSNDGTRADRRAVRKARARMADRPTAREGAVALCESVARGVRGVTVGLGVLSVGLLGFAFTQNVPVAILIGVLSAVSVWWARFSA